ncbi:A/G-specific adenine glycosylase [Alkaliphilus transvaalensis]|uniref:A/G-specific adenine glycosylase n=1 Tax=Alkaliphilus transvaalensis TaxID=114628 RepID=UPI0004788A87|nr:A/G-specific adenine glycosylase [Alkaliphilus transvaalensis]
MTQQIELVNNLLKWFSENKRWMPWRETKNPYLIWISEIMLQQTRVETVIDYYNRFIKKFPKIEDLAHASEEEVLKLWEGLGYYSRGRNLHKAAKQMVEKYEGVVPSSYKEIIKLPGVGPYTAGAILSIAYNQPVAAIDGNVMRVYSRLYHIEQDIMEKKTIDQVRYLVEGMMPIGNCNDFSEALMELGATVCTPKNPNCCQCPIQEYCLAKQLGKENDLPIRINKTKVTQHHKAILWIQREDKILIKKNKEKGLLAGMWVLPTLETQGKFKKIAEIQQEVDLSYGGIKINQYIGDEKHIFTHQKWNIAIFIGCCNKKSMNIEEEYQWLPIEELKNIALPTLYQKVISHCQSAIKE